MPRAKKSTAQKPKPTAQEPEPIERNDEMDVFDAGDDDKEEPANGVKKDKKGKKEKKEKKEKKNKKKQTPTDDSGDTTTEEQPANPPSTTSNRKKRKFDTDDAAETDQQPKKKAAAQESNGTSSNSNPSKKRKKSKAATTGTTMTATEIVPGDKPGADPLEAAIDAMDEKECNHRFIVFVGNIPFGTTQAALEAHFATVHPLSVRRVTAPVKDKAGQRTGAKQFRGIAFVEFPRYDYMKTALKLLHHSTITAPATIDPKTGQPVPDGKTVERKINVELTAGGGGNTDFRKNKIRTKNEKLKEERARRIVAETSAKEAKAVQAAWRKLTAKAGEGDAPGAEDDDKDVHPSRKGWVPASK
ncbi:hypothetical protein SLS62_001489 [Diatrype stigma]|uniref:RRM domain-containing protein n=1 Tax=Diatrype stigma TaxID=117547 RepID=A0AAN9V1D7_9PEZI